MVLNIAGLSLLAALPAAARAREQAAPSGVAREIIDGDTLLLEDGREVRLVGIQAPKLPLGRRNFPTWPLAEEARRALVELAQGRRLTLAYGTTPRDRHGRHLAHLAREDDGTWLQGEMLRRGMARVYTFPDNRGRAAEMLALEREARAAQRGIWALPWYRIRDTEEVARDIDTFQVVEGEVRRAALARTVAYLNFGEDFRTDFTVAIDSDARRLFRAAGLDPLKLQGTRIRVRGWLRAYNGPLIEATHPEQLEVLR